MQNKIVASLIAAMIVMGSEHTEGQDANLPNQTFSKCVGMSLSLGQIKQEEKKVEVKPQLDKDYMDTFIGEITAYTIAEGDKSPGDPEYGITASMTRARTHHTIAASRSLPFGTKVRIEGLPYVFTVEDRGGAIKGNKIDMLVGSNKEAEQWGRQHKKVYIISEGDGKRVAQ